jgi:hypothetical protein
MRKVKTVPLAEPVSRVMNYLDCPDKLYNALSEAILDLDSGQSENIKAERKLDIASVTSTGTFMGTVAHVQKN